MNGFVKLKFCLFNSATNQLIFPSLQRKILYQMKLLLILLFCLPIALLAQNTSLNAEGITPNLYITHTVLAKENYYSIGRMYNISPKEIAPFNKLLLENGLSLNQVIKVPLTTMNFLQAGNAAPDEVLVPVHHIVQDKEGLYRIAVNYNKLPLETLKHWNNIKGDAVPGGTHLIVGYLKVKPTLSSLAAMAKTKPADITNAQPVAAKQEPAAVITTAEPVKKEKAVVREQAAVQVKKDLPAVVKEVAPVAQSVATTTASKNFSGGTFKATFDKQLKPKAVNETGSGAVFKSNSGWQDGRYYCLHNTAAPGTIIKVTCISTGKTIYAKVLDVIPDIKQNGGLLIRISNSAAQELGLGETKFDCTLSYSK